VKGYSRANQTAFDGPASYNFSIVPPKSFHVITGVGDFGELQGSPQAAAPPSTPPTYRIPLLYKSAVDDIARGNRPLPFISGTPKMQGFLSLPIPQGEEDKNRNANKTHLFQD